MGDHYSDFYTVLPISLITATHVKKVDFIYGCPIFKWIEKDETVPVYEP